VNDAVHALEAKNIVLDDEEKATLIKRMMVITCSDQGQSNNVVNVGN
jgi:hypothetical protein